MWRPSGPSGHMTPDVGFDRLMGHGHAHDEPEVEPQSPGRAPWLDENDGERVKSRTLRFWTYLIILVPGVVLFLWIFLTLGDMSGYAFQLSDDPMRTAHVEAINWRTFNWHPTLMLMGFGCIMSSAIVSFKVLPISWRAQKYVHMVLQTAALILTSAGLAVIRLVKKAEDANEFYSAHSWLGIFTFGLFVAQFTVATLFFLQPQLFFRFFPAHESFIRTVLPWHVAAGLGIYFGAILSIVTGVLNRQSFFDLLQGEKDQYSSRYVVANVLAISVAIMGYTVYYHHKRPKRYSSESAAWSAF